MRPRELALVLFFSSESSCRDYLFATGVSHTIRDVVEIVFGFAGLEWAKYVVTDASLVRRDDRAKLSVDVARTRALLGWTERRPLEDTLFDMYECDCRLLGVSVRPRPSIAAP